MWLVWWAMAVRMAATACMTRTMIINPAKNPAHRTRHLLPGSMPNHHRHVSISETQPNVQHLPGSNKAKDPLIEFTIVHCLILSARIRKGTYLTHTEAGRTRNSVQGHFLAKIKMR